jgi:hypothetical protein
MATKIICDHCGNSIPRAFVYCFGPYEAAARMMYAGQQMAAQQAMAQGIGSTGLTNSLSGPVLNYPAPSLSTVDLCQHCQTIWMNRVTNLTKQSDV